MTFCIGTIAHKILFFESQLGFGLKSTCWILFAWCTETTDVCWLYKCPNKYTAKATGLDSPAFLIMQLFLPKNFFFCQLNGILCISET